MAEAQQYPKFFMVKRFAGTPSKLFCDLATPTLTVPAAAELRQQHQEGYYGDECVNRVERTRLRLPDALPGHY